MMLDRRQLNNDGAEMWHRSLHWKPVWLLLVFLFASVITGCGPSAASTTTVGLHPQLSVVTHPFHETVKTFDGDFTFTLDITPDRSGTNVFKVQVMDTLTHTPATHIIITLYATMQDMPMGTDSIILHAGDNGYFSMTSNALSMGGHWAIGITIQTPDHTIHKAGVRLLIGL